MIKVAIIGPKVLVQRVQEIGEQLFNFDFLPVPYNNEYESLDNALSVSQKVDVILFTGPVPYRLVYEHRKKLNSILLCVNYGGTGLYRVLFQMAKDGFLQLSGKNRFSIDFIDKEEVIFAFEELEIEYREMEIFEIENTTTPEQIFEYHYCKWQSGNVSCIITCLYSVYKKLKSLSIPAYCISPTRHAIQDALNLANSKTNEKTFEKNQITVCIISFENNLDPKIKEKKLKYISQILQTNGQKINEENYLFYTTKGLIYSLTSGYSKIPTFIQKEHFLINMGIGIGDTVIEATERARLSHTKSIKSNGEQLYIIEKENSVTSVFKKMENPVLKYDSRSYDELIRQIVEDTGLSFSTISKIKFICNASNKREFSATEIARQLNITVRSTRRILQTLVNKNYASIIGGEQPLTRGRPRQIYKLNI